MLRAAFARTDITPALGTPLGGYPVEDRVAEAIRDPLYANALVLARDGLTVALLSLDWLIIEQTEVETIRQAVAAQTTIQPEHVTVFTIQSHSAARTLSAAGWGDKVEPYIQATLPKIIEAVVTAASQLQPVTVGIGTTHSEVGVNRRQIRADHTVALGVNPWGPYDPIMTVLRVEGQQGPVATLIHYGAHPTVLNGKSRVVSRDWPGIMVDRLEELTGAPALFINGAVGDVAPRTNILGAVGDGEMALLETGTRAAMDALRAYRSIKDFRDLPLAALTSPIHFPYRPLPAAATAQAAMVAAEPHKERWGQPMCDYRHWQAVVAAHASGTPATGTDFTQTITQLGPVAIVPFPGEPFAEIVLRLRELSPFAYTLCASTTNGSFGYFVTRESLHRGGYEVWVARAFGAYIFAENIDDVLVEANVQLLQTLQQRSGQ
ncbi:MAG: neutral/alkaline non-lysosomal ceramidase N-terminal domain-containing protein [Caldilineaceae bacterium]|nr:neutral/alkaline non-lysosomal ceramidase N-terminal domain-containing protein [Caldilineaceae bacterium]